MNALWLLMPRWLKKVFATAAIISGAVLFVFNQGAKSNARKVETANVKAVSIANKGGAGTRDPSARGVRDPNTVD